MNGINGNNELMNQQRNATITPTAMNPIQVEPIHSFPVNQLQQFDATLASHIKAKDLIVTISNPIIGQLDTKLDWLTSNSLAGNKCRVSFRAPIVGIYTVSLELANQNHCGLQFQAKAYDLAKVFISGSSGSCRLDESYVFSVDASEAGEGQLEIAVNEGELPNEVQVLDNGRCIVNFQPIQCIPHVVDIKFNGHNVNGCPFTVQVHQPDSNNLAQPNANLDQQLVPKGKPSLTRDERIPVNETAIFSIDNIRPTVFDKDDLIVLDPDNRPINYKLTEDAKLARYSFEFRPTIVGDFAVELKPRSDLSNSLPSDIREQFPFSLKVFDSSKVIVSDVTDGVVGHPIYFFIDASKAGSGNLEIRVSSKTRNVPNYPQTEANAKIRVNFTPTELDEHSIDVKFNGIPVPGNPFLVKVAKLPQARLPVTSGEILDHVAINEQVNFYVDYIGSKENGNLPASELTSESCQVWMLQPDNLFTNLDSVSLEPSEKKGEGVRFKVTFKPAKIGPYKLFVSVNKELLPSSPIVSNVYDINEVKVYFDSAADSSDPVICATGKLNQQVAFTVDASRAGDGTLALAVLTGTGRVSVPTEVNVSERGHGLYNLTFEPTEFAPHTIDMTFNERTVPNSPFVVDILDAEGRSASQTLEQQKQKLSVVASGPNGNLTNGSAKSSNDKQMIQNFEALSLNGSTGKQDGNANKLSANKPQAKQANSVGSISGDSSSGGSTRQPPVTSKKSLAFGLVNASNIVFLESGVLESSKNQVSLIGPNDEKVPFRLDKGAPRAGEPKKVYIEYEPKSIGTHTIQVLDGDKELRQYFVEICDPSRIHVSGLQDSELFASKQVTFCIDSRESGEIQLDTISILGPASGKKSNSSKVRDGESTLLGKIKSISSSSSSSSSATPSAPTQPIEYSIKRLTEHQQEVEFIPRLPGRYIIDIRCLGQPVGASPYEIQVKSASQQEQAARQASMQRPQLQATAKGTANGAPMLTREDELLQSIVVHGVSLTCSPVNSTGAFIIETNRLAQARDFDVLITDPNNSLVDVQCYLQQNGNLLAEWMPRRVGSHKIEVLYKDRQVPGSPFVSEAFDPSSILIENVKPSLVYPVNESVQFRVTRRDAGHGELDVAITSPVGQDLPIDISALEGDDTGELVSFTPTLAGKYKVSITFGGYEVPKSPIIIVAKDADGKEPIKVNGAGLKSAELNRSAQFVVETSSSGELKIRIESGDREIVPKLEQSANSYTVKYRPTEIGYATISLYWNGIHVAGSPYSVPVNDLSKILFLSGTNKASNSNNQRIVDYEPKQPREITVDTSKCGPGELKAEAYCRPDPSIKFSVPVEQYAANRYRLVFTCPPRADQLPKGLSLRDLPVEATYLIRFYYNNLFVPEALASVVVSPYQPVAASSQQARETSLSRQRRPDKQADIQRAMESNNNNSAKPYDGLLGSKVAPISPANRPDCPTVALRGHGLVDARQGEEAEFTIDGSQAGPGKPVVRFSGPSEDIEVRVTQLGDKQLYKATYVAQVPGVYSLNVLWDNKQVAGCPVSVNVMGQCDPTKVLCSGDGLLGGILGEEIKTFIDTRRAGPGELTAQCTGPTEVASCELLDRGDGTFILYIKPQESGRHILTITYGGQDIPKSPFVIKVSGKPDPSKVRVYGPGVEHGVLSLYQSRFVCDTRGAGAGQLTVRIRGPKGAFRMETQRETNKDRKILCKYDPTEPGDYRIEVKWSGQPVPGSPFCVNIFDTQEELNWFLLGSRRIAQ